jgi:endonuclease YncB( thermonuclease family)
MKKILIAITLTLTTMVVFAQKQKPMNIYDFPITRVIDGDTVAFQANFLPPPLKQELSIRVFGVDTPEKGHRAQCPSEDQRGQAASAFTKNAITKAQKRQVAIADWDKYGGRVLGDILLDGQSLRTMLIQNGFAREYYGEAKTSWCN